MPRGNHARAGSQRSHGHGEAPRHLLGHLRRPGTRHALGGQQIALLCFLAPPYSPLIGAICHL